MTKKALYPGSFDPFTLGHRNIISRASSLFEQVTVGVAINKKKKTHLNLDERLSLARKATKDLENVNIEPIEGLVINYAYTHKYDVLLRGIRAANDFEMELELSQINSSLSSREHGKVIETVFLMTSPEYSFIRSSRVWELLEWKGDISALLPDAVADYLKEKNFGHI